MGASGERRLPLMGKLIAAVATQVVVEVLGGLLLRIILKLAERLMRKYRR
jgi:hypothetical protein